MIHFFPLNEKIFFSQELHKKTSSLFSKLFFVDNSFIGSQRLKTTK
jgi:hypothetical protein